MEKYAKYLDGINPDIITHIPHKAKNTATSDAKPDQGLMNQIIKKVKNPSTTHNDVNLSQCDFTFLNNSINFSLEGIGAIQHIIRIISRLKVVVISGYQFNFTLSITLVSID